jgi:hypothetical protein
MKNQMMKWIYSIATFIASLLLCALVAFYIVLFLAGPHAGIVPAWVQKIILLLGWIFTIAVPVFIARKVFVNVKARSKNK